MKETSCTYTERGLRHLTATNDASAIREKLGRMETIVNRIVSPDSCNSQDPAAANIGNGPSLPRSDVRGQSSLSSGAPGGTQSPPDDGLTQRWVNAAHWESIVEDVQFPELSQS